MNDFAEEALTDEHMQRLQHDSEIGCQSRYAAAGEESGGIEAYASESYEDEAPRGFPPEDGPLWDGEGKPTNLRAAAFDAIEWLNMLQSGSRMEPVNASRLKDAIAALRLFCMKDVQ